MLGNDRDKNESQNPAEPAQNKATGCTCYTLPSLVISWGPQHHLCWNLFSRSSREGDSPSLKKPKSVTFSKMVWNSHVEGIIFLSFLFFPVAVTIAEEPTMLRWGQEIKRRGGNTIFIFLVPAPGEEMKVRGFHPKVV